MNFQSSCWNLLIVWYNLGVVCHQTMKQEGSPWFKNTASGGGPSPSWKNARTCKSPRSVRTKGGLGVTYLLLHFSDYLCSNLYIDPRCFRSHTRSDAPDMMYIVSLSIPNSQHDLLSDIFSLYTSIINDSLYKTACLC